MNEVLDCLMTRRSIKSYSEKLVEEEKIKAIVEAGKYAPCGMGAQGTMMVVLTDKEEIKRVSQLNAEVMGAKKDPFYGAPALIVVFADSTRPTFVEDGSLVMGNLLNAAHSLSVDSCWIHRARETFDMDEGRRLKATWGVPHEYVGIGNCILGYGEPIGERKPRKDNFVIFR